MFKFVKNLITSLFKPSRLFWEWKYHEVVAEQIKLSFLHFLLISALSCYSAIYQEGNLPLVGSIAGEFIQIKTGYIFFLLLIPLFTLFTAFLWWKVVRNFIARIISRVCQWSFIITVTMTAVVAGLAVPFSLSLIETESLGLKLGGTLFLLFTPSFHYLIAKCVEPGALEKFREFTKCYKTSS